MFCNHCGNKLDDDAKFCHNCGEKMSGSIQTQTVPLPTPAIKEEGAKTEKIIRCGNCSYEGPGKLARTKVMVVLAWLCIFFAWPITVLYFAFTHKYKCPKCGSTFLGVKNEKGVFVGQEKSAKPLKILVFTLLGIAILGIISSVILASLNAAREKANQAQQSSHQF